MNMDEIDGALHEISMMVSVLLGAKESLRATGTTPRVFQMPDEAGELLCFSIYDIDKRVKDLKAGLFPQESAKAPVLTLVPPRGRT